MAVLFISLLLTTTGKLDIDAIQEKLSKYTMEDDPPSNAAAACNGRSNNKNVSFAQETTILQEVSVESAAKNRTEEFEATQPYQPGSMDIKKVKKELFLDNCW